MKDFASMERAACTSNLADNLAGGVSDLAVIGGADAAKAAHATNADCVAQVSDCEPVELIRLAGVAKDSVVDGPGVRHVLFLQGCVHHCVGCHNPQTHALDGGKLCVISELVAEIANKPWLSGVTFSGGEPFLQPRACLEVIWRLRRYPQLAHFTYLSYSGYLHEQLQAMGERDTNVRQFLAELDILIDGPFVLAQRDLNLAFRGSRNQRILQLKEIRERM